MAMKKGLEATHASNPSGDFAVRRLRRYVMHAIPSKRRKPSPRQQHRQKFEKISYMSNLSTIDCSILNALRSTFRGNAGKGCSDSDSVSGPRSGLYGRCTATDDERLQSPWVRRAVSSTGILITSPANFRAVELFPNEPEWQLMQPRFNEILPARR